MKRRYPPLPERHHYMVLSGLSWGRGETVAEAKQELARETSKPFTRLMIVPKGAWIEPGQSIVWKSENGHGAGFCPHCNLNVE